jgi:transmembrane sensor
MARGPGFVYKGSSASAPGLAGPRRRQSEPDVPKTMTGPARTSIDEEAVTWFALLRDDEVTADDRARFAAWLEADSRHRQAWREVEAMWTGMDRLRSAGDAISPFPGRNDRREAARVAPTRWRRLAALAATILIMMGGTGLWAVQPTGLAAALFADHRTGMGESRSIALADGSTVALGASSALSVAFDGAARRVVLHRGEGYFAVTADAARPFVVDAPGGRITVIGTEFDVKVAGDVVGVAVTSGIVEVAAGGSAPVRLRRGEGVRYGAGGLEPVHAVDAADVGFWRNGRMIFQAAPLGEVLHDLERYRRGRIVVTDDRIAALPVTGVFDTRRPDAALDTIMRTLPVRIVYVADLLVLVRPAD